MSSSVQATFCATLVDEWVRAGITDAVVAPGSRSTPIVLALAAEAGIMVHVHHDERAAGFTALGLGRASGHPALVVTTSGTAAVELHPAIVEADLSCVPLIAITADRPPELHHVGAPQTVDQHHLFGRSARWFAEPGVATAQTQPSWRSLASRAVAEATTGVAGPGPVHLNLAFREPLVGEPGVLPPGRDGGVRWHTTVGRRLAVDRLGTERLTQLLDADRGVIVAGAGAGDPEVVAALAHATGWPVLADPLSGCRGGGPEVVAAFDLILRHEPSARALAPDVVLRLGARPASKVLSTWLAGLDATEVAVDAHGRWFDPDHRSAHVLHADPTAAAQAMVHLVGGRAAALPRWGEAWRSAEIAAQGAVDAVLDVHDEPTEPGVAREVMAVLEPGSSLVVSSSMPIRDLEWFARPRHDVATVANRGANGIDGVVSTALGVALAGSRRRSSTVVLVGDVAFLHDATALVGIGDRGVDLTVVVVDNDGGGIFSFLPQAGELDPGQFEQLFGTPHGVDVPTLGAAHGLITVEPASAPDVATAVRASIQAGGVRIVRVPTDRSANVVVHQEIYDAVAAALDAARL